MLTLEHFAVDFGVSQSVYTGANLPFYFLRSADTSVRMFDRRNLTSGGVGSPVHIFQGHNAAVLCVQVFQDYVFLAFLFLHVLSGCICRKEV